MFLCVLVTVAATADAVSVVTGGRKTKPYRWADRSGDRQVQGCTGGWLSCPDGRCISPTWRCDGEVDCTGGSDEVSGRSVSGQCEVNIKSL